MKQSALKHTTTYLFGGIFLLGGSLGQAASSIGFIVVMREERNPSTFSFSPGDRRRAWSTAAACNNVPFTARWWVWVSLVTDSVTRWECYKHWHLSNAILIFLQQHTCDAGLPLSGWLPATQYFVPGGGGFHKELEVSIWLAT